jgi:hypothetical protein
MNINPFSLCGSSNRRYAAQYSKEPCGSFNPSTSRDRFAHNAVPISR